MIMYHGSKYIIERPEYGKGNIHNDYGQAFYCTEDYDLAAEWAVSESDDGYINSYSIELENLKILDLRDEKYSVLNWISILLSNRIFEINNMVARNGKDFIINNYSVPYDEYDVIIGWRADDSYFSYAKAFLNNTISVEALKSAMILGNLGIQFAFRSEEAINALENKGFSIAEKKVYLKNKLERDSNARQDYLDMLGNRNMKNETFLIDIMRNN